MLAASIPTGLKHRSQANFRLTELGLAQSWVGNATDDAAELWKLLESKVVSLKHIRQVIPNGEKILKEFRDRGWVEAVESAIQKQLYRLDNLWEWTGEIDYSKAIESLPVNAHQIKKAIETLSQSNGSLNGAELRRLGGGLNSQLRSLVKKGWVTLKKVPRDLDGYSQEGISETGSEGRIYHRD